MNKEHLAFLVKAYTENTIDREGYDELMAYISHIESGQELDTVLQAIWNEENNEHDFDQQRQETIFLQITNNPKFDQVNSKPLAKVVHWSKWLSVAAASVILAVAVPVTWRYFRKSPKQITETFIVKDIPYGKKIQMQLPDGTLVWVNSGSSIRYPASFSAAKREIFLEGEAFFDVVHDVKRPFIIHTGKVFTEVLGTAFDIRAYGASTMSVTVARGKVSVGVPEKLLGVLTPNQTVNYSFKSGIASTRRVDASKLKWMNGELSLSNTTLAEANQELERWFNVKIDIQGGMVLSNNHRFSATFLNHENIDQVMKVLSELCRFNYQLNGRHIIIKRTKND